MVLDRNGPIFVAVDRAGGELLFNVLSARHGRRGVVITTHFPFSEWPEVFVGEKLTTALFDSLGALHHHHTPGRS